MKSNTTHKTIFAAVAVLAALALPMVAGAADTNEPKLVVKDSTGVTDRMVVTDMGRIGIGTSIPEGPIHVVSTGNTAKSAGFVLRHTAEGADPEGDAAPNFSFLRSNTADVPISGVLPRKDDALGFLNFLSTSGLSRAQIKVGAEAAWTSANQPSYIRFYTAAYNGTSTAASEKMRLTSAGNLGVGVSNPTQKLVVNGGVRLSPTATKPACISTIRGTFWFTADGTNQNDSIEICAYKAGVLGWQSLY